MSITVTGVSKSFGSRVVFEDVTLTCAQGSLTAITGPSGCGKSTLLAIMAHWLTPDRGDVVIAPRSPHLEPAIDLLAQSTPLLDRRTLLDNVTVGAVCAGTDRRDVTGEALLALELMGLAGRTDTRARELSGGERQRLSLARTLVRQPDILFADEITASLDNDSVRIVTDALVYMAERGTTVVLATHDQRVATRSDQVIDMLGYPPHVGSHAGRNSDETA